MQPGLYIDDETGQTFRIDDQGNEYEVPSYAADRGAFESAMIGAGKTMTNIGANVSDLWEGLGGQEFVANPSEFEQQAYDALARENPTSTMIGEALPGLSTAPVTFGGGLATQMAANTAMGAAEGALVEGDMAGALKGAAGGFGGDIAGRAISRAVDLFRGVQAEQVLPEAAQTILKHGGQLKPSDRVAEGAIRRPMQIIESAMQSNPMAAGALEKIADANQGAANKLAIKALGLERVEDLTQTGMTSAYEEIGKLYTKAAKEMGDVTLDASNLEDISDLVRNSKLLKNNALDAALEMGGDSVDIKAIDVMKIRSELSDQAATANSWMQREAAKDALKRLDKSIEATGGAGTALYKQARQKAEILNILDTGNIIKDGDVNTKLLRNKLNQKFKSNYVDDMAKRSDEAKSLAEFAQAASSKDLTSQFGRSGSPERAAAWADPAGWAGAAAAIPYMMTAGRPTTDAARIISALSSRAGAGLMSDETPNY